MRKSEWRVFDRRFRQWETTLVCEASCAVTCEESWSCWLQQMLLSVQVIRGVEVLWEVPHPPYYRALQMRRQLGGRSLGEAWQSQMGWTHDLDEGDPLLSQVPGW